MNFDQATLGTALIFTVLIPILAVLVMFLLLYMVIRDGITSGLRRHQLWMEQRGSHQPRREYQPITPPQYSPPEAPRHSDS